MAATFTGMGRGKAGPEEQFIDAPEEDTEEDLPLVLEDAKKQPKEGKPGASKSKGKKLAQATEGAEAPPEETPPDPKPTKPQTDPAPAEPQPGTSKAPTEDPTQAPTDKTAQPSARNPDEDEPPAPTKYVMAYKAAGKDWLDSVVEDGEEAYTRLFDTLNFRHNQPGTSKAPTEDPTQAPTDETAQPSIRNPDEDEPPAPTKYVMAYKAAGKDWLYSVVEDGEEAYTRLFDKLLV